MPLFEMECGPRCRSKRHALQLNSAISKGTLAQVKAYSRLCYNAARYPDTYGRSALHVAAAVGKVDVVQWLLEEKGADLSHVDRESGWTALHRTVFYGQLAAARLLIQFKSDLYVRDHEGLSPLDITIKDRSLITSLPPAVYAVTDRHEVSTWGDNSNFTLGHVAEQRRLVPEPVDEFRKHGISIKQVEMCKYHTVFLTADGHVYTCGHGLGGRLGHTTESTCLVPKRVEGLTEAIMQVAASRDHTVMLSCTGVVYSCGLNDYHQLGIMPIPDKCLVPRQISSKSLRGCVFRGVCAGRFHTVIYTDTAVYTCGLNAGQLGHPKQKGDRRISQLRHVSSLNYKGWTVTLVSCSDAATVVLTGQGDIYVLHEYQCRKIASKWLEIDRMCVVGGHLDHTDSQVLRENGGSQLVIGLLSKAGKVFVWRVSSPSLKRAHWQIERQLHVKDFILTESGAAIVTSDGEVFICTLNSRPQQTKEMLPLDKKDHVGEFGRMSLLELLSQEECEEVEVRRVPNVHRASYITADRKGHNYAVLQSLPNCSLTDVPSVSKSEMISSFQRLLDETDQYDTIYDVLLKVEDEVWPAHKFILVNRCANFPSLLSKCVDPASEGDIQTVCVSDLHPQILEQLLKFVYTDACDLLTVGTEFTLKDDHSAEDIFQMDIDSGNPSQGSAHHKKVSAFQVHQESKKGDKSDQKESSGFHNPVKLLQDAARRFGVKGLSKRLEAVKYSKGCIVATARQQQKPKLKFDRNKLRDSKWELFDVAIKSEDGVMFPCHKCVLVARLEYFHSMLASGWLETSSNTALTLPIPADILDILIEFIYTDESQVVATSLNVELLCNVLVVADQMIVVRLKEMCEASVATLITLKNVGELLEFASVYNAHQLKATCQQYITINMAALLEGRCLDILSDEVLEELTRYYKQLIPNMSRRIITPYDEHPEKSFLESLVTDESDHSPPTSTVEPKKSKPRRKRGRTKSTAEDQEKPPSRGARRTSERQISISSDVSVKSDDDLSEIIDQLVEEQSLSTVSTNNKLSSPESPAGPTSLPFASPPPTPGPWPSPSPDQGVWTSPGKVTTSGDGPQAVNLRAIIREEETTTRIKSPSEKKTGKFSWKNVKKQQQQQQHQQQQQSQHLESGDTTANQKVTPSCPWGSVTKVVESFRNLMVAEETAVSPPQSQKSCSVGSIATGTNAKLADRSPGNKQATQSASILSWGLPKKATKPTTASIPATSPTTERGSGEASVSPRSTGNPWQIGVARSQPDTACSFSEIVKDEMEKTDVLIQTANKPLGLIQIEEQAIQDLLVHYKAAETLDCRVTVERVPRLAATPLWKRERLQSS